MSPEKHTQHTPYTPYDAEYNSRSVGTRRPFLHGQVMGYRQAQADYAALLEAASAALYFLDRIVDDPRHVIAREAAAVQLRAAIAATAGRAA